MSKLVDNLLGKLDQLKRKVMADTESNGDKPIEPSNNLEKSEAAADAKGDSNAVAAQKKERRPGRPRRKYTKAKPKPRASGAAGPKETAPQASKQVKKGQETRKRQRDKKGREGTCYKAAHKCRGT